MRYVIGKPSPVVMPHNVTEQAAQRLRKLQKQRRLPQQAFIAELDARDPLMPYLDRNAYNERMRARMSLRALHESR